MLGLQHLRAGTEVFIAAPKVPMPADRVKILQDAVKRELQIAFAYIPLFFIPKHMNSPRQVLYLVLSTDAHFLVDRLMDSLRESIGSKWEGDYIDVYAN